MELLYAFLLDLFPSANFLPNNKSLDNLPLHARVITGTPDTSEARLCFELTCPHKYLRGHVLA